jgi:three-Cys-motif partner protein
LGYGETGTIGAWSKRKLQLLSDYLPIYLKACRRAQHRYYVDAFAGRGRWKVRGTGEVVEGSPRIALQHLVNFTKVFLVEMDKSKARDLMELKMSSLNADKVEVFIDDANEAVKSIFSKIHPKAPTFVFLDPSGDQLHWSTIDYISHWQTELYVLYPSGMTIMRYLSRDQKLDDRFVHRLNQFFGCEDWRHLYEHYVGGLREKLPKALLDLYVQRMRDLGYSQFYQSECYRTRTYGSSGQRLYYMIWAGKHEVGGKIMKSISRLIERDDQLELGLSLD